MKTNPIREGIATSTPDVTLDVNGEIRPDYTGIACSATIEGAIRYDSAGNIHEFCDGSSWASLGGGVSEINDLSDAITDYVTDNNMSIGSGAGASLAAGGTSNILIGENAGTSITVGDNNVVVGFDALRSGADSRANIAIGRDALELLNFTGNSRNTAVGYHTMFKTTTGIENTAVGAAALDQNTTGSSNVGFGGFTLSGNRTGSDNTAIGRGAGSTAGFNSTLNRNVFVGRSAGNNVDTGTDDNIFVGYQAGDLTTSGASNIIIGSDVDAPAATTSNHLNIGDTIYGDLSTDKVGIGIVTPISTLHIPDGKYLQAEDNNAGAPASADCDADNERGRQSIDTKYKANQDKC